MKSVRRLQLSATVVTLLGAIALISVTTQSAVATTCGVQEICADPGPLGCNPAFAHAFCEQHLPAGCSLASSVCLNNVTSCAPLQDLVICNYQ